MNLLVIDDEQAIRDMVLKQVKNMGIRFGQIDGAASAKEARERMKERTYEIFLCDIVMPDEDGITFAKWVLSHYPDVKFIFLTAHADFAYMKEAIAMQSFDYLLQPASEEELRQVVEKAVTQIKIEEKNRMLQEKGNFFADYEMQLLGKGSVDYLTGQTKNRIYLEQLLKKSIPGKEDTWEFLPVLLQILSSGKNMGDIPKPLLQEIYRNIVGETLEPLSLGAEVIPVGEELAICLLYCKGESWPERKKVQKLLELLSDLFAKALETEIALYYGNVTGLEQLREEMAGTLDKKDNNIRREKCVLFTGMEGRVIDEYSFEHQTASWKALLDKKKIAEFGDSLLGYCKRYARKSEMSREYLIRLHQVVTELILGYLVNNEIESRQVFDEGFPYLEYMNCWSDMQSFMRAVEYVVKKAGAGNPEESRDVTEEAIKYIRANVDREISVSEVADHVGMTPEYLTKVFKKNTGMGLKSFLTREKLDTAKMLLATTQMSVTMIAEHVGYGSYSNFIRTFRQIEGCTPLEYRQRCGNATV